MNIWTRQRKLKDAEKAALDALRLAFKTLKSDLDNDDWRSAAEASDDVTTICVRLEKIERELENVDGIVDAFDRIERRMEKLEQEAKS